jgi:hypothetical protein
MRQRVRGLFEERAPERLVLVFGLLTGVLGVALAASEFLDSPELDYQAYYFTGRAVVRGEEFVGTAIHEGSFLTDKEYVYTPITAPVFAGYGLLPEWQIGYVINIALLSVVFFLIARLGLDFIESQGGSLSRVDRWLIVGFHLFSGHTVLALFRGNVDPIILLMLAVGFLAMEGDEQVKGGVLWAVAALFKLFPAVLGIWMLYRRRYRAIAAAVVTGVGFTLLGIAVFGIDAHLEFIDFILNERSRQGAFEGGLDPNITWITLRRPLSQVLALSGNQLILVSAAIASPVVALVYRDADSTMDRMVAFFATMLVLLITIVPSTLNYVVYLYFPLVALVYLVEERRSKQLFLAGLVLVSLPLYPEQVELILSATPLPGGVVDALVAGARAVMTYVSVPLAGFLVLLAGCLRYVRLPESETSTETDQATAPAGD